MISNWRYGFFIRAIPYLVENVYVKYIYLRRRAAVVKASVLTNMRSDPTEVICVRPLVKVLTPYCLAVRIMPSMGARCTRRVIPWHV